MSKQINDKMHLLKKVFCVLLAIDTITSIVTDVTLLTSFKEMAEYGKLMLGIVGGIYAVMAAVQLFEILAKVFLIRSTSPEFSWTSGRKGYVAAAKLLFLFNLGTAILFVLSAGGEGATLISEIRTYLQVLFAAAEMIAVFIYLRTVKKL